MAGGFRTDRMDVVPWHDLPDETLASTVVDLLTPNVTASLPPSWARPDDEAAVARWIGRRDAESTVLAAVERSDGRPIGLMVMTGEREVRVGYLLTERVWGRGLATELLTGWVESVRAAGETGEVVAGVASDNAGSRRVLERCGFTLAGQTHGGELEYRLWLADGAPEHGDRATG